MKKAIEWLAANQDAIQAEWTGRLAMKLREEGRHPPGIPEGLVHETLSRYLKHVEGKPLSSTAEPARPTFEEMLRGFSSKLIHHLELFLIGEEVIEDLLIEHFSTVKEPPLELLNLVESTHVFFHDLVGRETRSYCGKCVEPSESILKYLIQHRHTPPLKSNPL